MSSPESLTKFQDFTRVALNIFATVGIDPFETLQNHGLLYNFFKWFIFHLGRWNIVYSVFGEFVYLVSSFGRSASFLEITAVAPCIVFCLKVLGKFQTILQNAKPLTHCVRELESIFPQTVEEQNEFCLQKYVKHMRTIIKYYVIFCMSAIWVFNLYEVCFSAFEYYFVSGAFEKDLPFLIWYPFSTENHWVYGAVYFHQSYAGYVAVCVLVGTDYVMCSIIIQIIMHFDYISRQLSNMVPMGDDKDDIHLARLIRHHIRILR